MKDKAEEEYNAALYANGFADENDYHAALPGTGETWIRDKNDEIAKYETGYRDLQNKIEILSKECDGKILEDIGRLTNERINDEDVKKSADAEYTGRNSTRDSHKTTLDQIAAIHSQIEAAGRALNKLSVLNDTVKGENIKDLKLSFKRYIMGATFREILDAANARLNTMTGGRYEFKHMTEGRDARATAGLGIEIMDYQTGRLRSVQSICGGESFQMSMSLALGLSDIVQRHSGGQAIDTMFIDEGFGSLDDQSLDAAITSLEELAGDARQIGIISHVAKLEECISPKIIVKCTDKGSKISIN